MDLFQLPPDISDFTGRDSEVAMLRSRLEQGEETRTATVVTTIVGKGGVGKTALAVHVAHLLQSRFPDGQLYVNLRGVEAQALNPHEVLADFLRTLGVDGAAIPSGIDERARIFRARLVGRRLLVVLDNAANEAQVRPLLPGSQGCAVLITSRTYLPGLEAATTVDLDVLESDQALELLAKVAGWDRVADEPTAAREIIEACGYLPLAVRITGARLATKKHWALTRSAERLRDERHRLNELRAGDLDVRATFALSYQGQDDQLQRAFRLLGVLNATDFAAWVVSALLNVDLSTAEDAIERLVDVKLLEAAGNGVDGQARYRFHDLLRIFARDRLQAEEPDNGNQALRQVLGMCLTLAERADAALQAEAPDSSNRTLADSQSIDPQILSAVLRDPLRWFVAERTNLVIAVEQASELEAWKVAAELPRVLVAFFDLRSHWTDWERTHEFALAAARRAGDRWGEAVTLCNLGRGYEEQGRSTEAIACLDQCLPIFRKLGDRRWEANALFQLGVVFRHQARSTEAMARFEQCLVIFRELGDRRWEAYALRSLGDLYRDLSRWDEAMACFQQCLVIFRELGDRRWGEARALRSLGDLYRDLSRWDEAMACFQQCLVIFRELGDHRWEARALCSLGGLYRDLSRWDEAMACFQQCLVIFRELGDHRWEAEALSGMGMTSAAQGNELTARRYWEEALRILRGLGDSKAYKVEAWIQASHATMDRKH
jgi:tetratricopeptide (TPR) repeat protein